MTDLPEFIILRKVKINILHEIFQMERLFDYIVYKRTDVHLWGKKDSDEILQTVRRMCNFM